jgi:hypothetical protein
LSPGIQSAEQVSVGGTPGYSSSAPMYLTQDQVHRMNAGVRPGPGAQFQYGPPGMQPFMRGRPVGPFSPYGQFQGNLELCAEMAGSVVYVCSIPPSDLLSGSSIV